MINQNKVRQILSKFSQWWLVLLFLCPVLPEWRINAVFVVFCVLAVVSVFFIKSVNFWQLFKKNAIITIPFIPYLI